MRKEIVFAIVFGSILGLIVAFGIWRVNSALSPKNEEANKIEASPTPLSGFLVTLAKPENNDVIIQNPMEVNGLTKANALVAVSAEDEDYLTAANDQGLFQESVDLIGGVNQILLTSFDEAGNIATNKVLVVFSSEFKKIIDNLTSQSASETNTATVEADSVRERVEQKVEEALNKPKAYLGLVSDISETTIEIKSAEGEIQQVGVGEDTTYIKDGATAKTVDAKDLAIGDYIVAMGFKNGNAVLNAKRILITQPPASLNRQVLSGRVERLTTTDFALIFPNNQGEPVIIPQKSAAYLTLANGQAVRARYADIKEGAKVVVFGLKGEKSFSARTVFLVNP